METSEEKVRRAESKQRRELNKAFVLALKKRAKGTAWRISPGVLFQNFYRVVCRSAGGRMG
jgi:hypothetical protein